MTQSTKCLIELDCVEIGHGKQVSVKTADDLTIRKEVKGVHEDLKLDNYGLSSVKTCIGQLT